MLTTLVIYKSTIAGSAALVAPVASYFWFARAADRAMDKAGVGDVAAWKAHSSSAGVSFWVAVSVWLALFFLAMLRRGSEREQLVTICVAALIIVPVIWFLEIVST